MYIHMCVGCPAFQLKLRWGSAEDLNAKCPSRRCVAWDETLGFKLLLVVYQHIIPCWLTSTTISDVFFSFRQNKEKGTVDMHWRDYWTRWASVRKAPGRMWMHRSLLAEKKGIITDLSISWWWLTYKWKLFQAMWYNTSCSIMLSLCGTN